LPTIKLGSEITLIKGINEAIVIISKKEINILKKINDKKTVFCFVVKKEIICKKFDIIKELINNIILYMKFIKYLVIGSGISSYAFLSELNNNKRKETLVITGKTKKKTNRFQYDQKELDLDVRHEFGGLANTWLGGYSDFNKNEIYSIKNKIAKNLYDSLIKFKKEIKIYNYFNSFENKLPKFINQLLAQKKSNFELFKIKILNNFLSKNKNIMRPKKIKNVKYINGYVVNIIKNGKWYITKILIQNKSIEIKSEFIFLGCGTFDTSKILIDLNLLKPKIQILHQPYFQGVMLLKSKDTNKYNNINLPILGYNFKNTRLNCQGSLGLYSDRINSIIKEKTLGLLSLKKIKNYAYNNMLFFNCFINSSKSKLFFSKKNNSFIVENKFDKEEMNKYSKKILENIKKKLKILGVKILFTKSLFLKIGSDKHYFGSVSKKNFKNLNVSKNSEILNMRKIFIIDQSIIDIKTSKFITLLAILNSINVGKYINKKDTK
jgi:hypothetical protein